MIIPIWYRNNLELGTSSLKIHKICLIGVIIIHLISLQAPFAYNTQNETSTCSTSNSTLINLFSFILTSLIGQVLPFFVLLLSNLTFSRALLSRRQSKTAARSVVDIHELQGQNRANTNSAKVRQERTKLKNETSYIRMLVLVTSAFLFLNMTTLGLFIASAQLTNKYHSNEKNFRHFLYLATAVPLALSHACNIVFYIISGPMFRKALTRTFCACIHPLQNT